MDDFERRRIQNREAQRRFRQRHNQRKAAANQTTQTAANANITTVQDAAASGGLESMATALSSTALPSSHSSPPPERLVEAPSSAEATTTANSLLPVDFDYGMGLYSSSLLDIDFAASDTGCCCMHDHDPRVLTANSSSSPSSLLQVSPTNTSSDSNTEQLLDALIAGIPIHNSESSADTARSGSVGVAPSNNVPADEPGETAADDGTSNWQNSLHIAATRGFDRIARMLLLQQNIDCNERDSDGFTPLILATIGGYDDVVNSLLLHGAALSIVDSQHHRSVLHWAIVHRRDSLLKILLDRCVAKQTPIDLYEKSGRTPLHMAVDMGYDTGVQLLLQAGANAQYKTKRQPPFA